MNITVSGEEVKEYKKLDILSQLALIKEKIKFFENKYRCKFEDFEKKLKESGENFEKWDDFIEWKAYVESARDLQRKMREIEHAENIRIT